MMLEQQGVAGGARAQGTAVAAAEPPIERVNGTERNLLALYLREVGSYVRLTPEEELEAAQRIEAAEVALWRRLLAQPPRLREVVCALRTLQIRRRGLKKQSLLRAFRAVSPPGDPRREKDLLSLARRLRRVDEDQRLLLTVIEGLRAGSGCDAELEELLAEAQRARHAFMVANLRLVVSVAKRFDRSCMPLTDLIQEGNIGLIKAVARYDPRLGYRFSTYAVWWIRHAIGRALAQKGQTVRVPRMDGTHLEEGHEGCRFLSLDHSIAPGERTYLELLADPRTSLFPEKVEGRSLTSEALAVLDQLSSLEADVVRRRFGLEGLEAHTLEDLGSSHQVTRERIRQIQQRALAKMRRALRRRNAI